MAQIVVVNVTVQEAAAPSTLQSTGALISQGGTILSAGQDALITQPSDLTPLLPAPLALSSLVWAAGTVTATTVPALTGLQAGDTFITTIAGATPATYNGAVVATVTGGNSFTFPLANNPGAETVAGTYTPPGQGELQAMVNSFFAQDTTRTVYVLELGQVDATSGPPVLQTFIQNNPKTFYSYLVPRSWDGSAAFLALQAQYQTPQSMTYFFTTTTTGTYQAYTKQMKGVLPFVEAPGLAIGAFDFAADFQKTLNLNPSPTNRMLRNGNGFLFGVTPYPTKNNANLLRALDAANISYIKTGAEGGLPGSNVLSGGKTADGMDFSWWYAADYATINISQDLANAVLLGANDPTNPLYYNQDGIDTLQDKAAARIQIAISSGLATGTVTKTSLDPTTFARNLANGVYAGQNVVNAVPFNTYVAQNPNDYGAEVYKGLSAIFIPQNSFAQIIFNLTVTNLLSS